MLGVLPAGALLGERLAEAALGVFELLIAESRWLATTLPLPTLLASSPRQLCGSESWLTACDVLYLPVASSNGPAVGYHDRRRPWTPRLIVTSLLAPGDFYAHSAAN